ncbi:Uncharacterised protein [Chlamydia trachomatis]|nr:Uncharacterised protein [Chlamydia trachomatis]
MIIRSGFKLNAALTADTPSQTTLAFQPLAAILCAIAVAKSGSSSTTRIVRGALVCNGVSNILPSLDSFLAI